MSEINPENNKKDVILDTKYDINQNIRIDTEQGIKSEIKEGVYGNNDKKLIENENNTADIISSGNLNGKKNTSYILRFLRKKKNSRYFIGFFIGFSMSYYFHFYQIYPLFNYRELFINEEIKSLRNEIDEINAKNKKTI